MKVLHHLLVILVVLFCIASPVFGQGASDVQSTIEELKNKITELQGQENSLSKQIGLLDSQITITSLRIATIEVGITRLGEEIDSLNKEIDRLEELKTKRLELVLHRIPHAYKRSVVSQFGIVLLSKNFSDFLSRVKYVTTVQEQDAQFYTQLQNTQDHFNERKTIREKKKVDQETLGKQLAVESLAIARQKRDKQALLQQTKNSEIVYQQLLAQALAEKQAIDKALANSVKVGPIKKGDPIALVGNTGYPGCSTGAHLHFEVRKNNSWVDPAPYLSSKTIQDEQEGGTWTVGSGSWDWPLSDTIRMTQHYGHTRWSWQYDYSGGIHTGFDMVSTSSTVIRAPADGMLYSSSQTCGSSSIIKIKYIEHADGLVSFYLHVQ